MSLEHLATDVLALGLIAAGAVAGYYRYKSYMAPDNATQASLDAKEQREAARAHAENMSGRPPEM